MAAWMASQSSQATKGKGYSVPSVPPAFKFLLSSRS
jgi:hypothetical protein